MVWQENVHQIIMLTNIIEDGKVGHGRHYDNRTELTYKYNHSKYAFYLLLYLLMKWDIYLFNSKVKCEHYWPESDEPLILGDLDIRLQSDKHFASYSIRQMTLSYEVPSVIFNKLHETQKHFKRLIIFDIF